MRNKITVNRAFKQILVCAAALIVFCTVCRFTIFNSYSVYVPLPEAQGESLEKRGLSVEVEAAITETPMSHHGMERPERKNSFVLEEPFRAVRTGIARRIAKKTAMMIQSMLCIFHVTS